VQTGIYVHTSRRILPYAFPRYLSWDDATYVDIQATFRRRLPPPTSGWSSWAGIHNRTEEHINGLVHKQITNKAARLLYPAPVTKRPLSPPFSVLWFSTGPRDSPMCSKLTNHCYSLAWTAMSAGVVFFSYSSDWARAAVAFLKKVSVEVTFGRSDSLRTPRLRSRLLPSFDLRGGGRVDPSCATRSPCDSETKP